MNVPKQAFLLQIMFMYYCFVVVYIHEIYACYLVSSGLISRLVINESVDVFTTSSTSSTVRLNALRAPSTTLKLHCGVTRVGVITSSLRAK